jgi:cytidine deaminase
VALLTSNGRIFAGSYIENAAFNPSLPPLQAALAGYFAAGDKAGKIQRAVLAEGEKSTISQHTTTKSTLSAFASSALLERVTFSETR